MSSTLTTASLGHPASKSLSEPDFPPASRLLFTLSLVTSLESSFLFLILIKFQKKLHCLLHLAFPYLIPYFESCLAIMSLQPIQDQNPFLLWYMAKHENTILIRALKMNCTSPAGTFTNRIILSLHSLTIWKLTYIYDQI